MVQLVVEEAVARRPAGGLQLGLEEVIFPDLVSDSREPDFGDDDVAPSDADALR